MKRTIHVANIGLINNKNNILLLKRSKNLNKPGFWGFPGGMIDTNENAQSAAIRELLEETGIDEKKYKFITSKKFLIIKPDENVEITAYLAKIIGDTKISLDPFEHVDYKWVNLENVFGTIDLMPGIPTILKELLNLENIIDRTIIKPSKIKFIAD